MMNIPQFEYLPSRVEELKTIVNNVFKDVNDKRFLVYELIRCVIDDAISEHAMGFGHVIEMTSDEKTVAIRNYGRGVPLNKVAHIMLGIGGSRLIDCLPFKTTPAGFVYEMPYVTATSEDLYVASFRQNKCSYTRFIQRVIADFGECLTNEPDGLLIQITPDRSFYGDYRLEESLIKSILNDYSYLYPNLVFHLNGQIIQSEKGLVELVNNYIGDDALYAPIELSNRSVIRDDLSVVVCHSLSRQRKVFSFANDRFAPKGGTHEDAVLDAVRRFFEKEFHGQLNNIDAHLVIACSINLRPCWFTDVKKQCVESMYMWEKYNWNTEQIEPGPPVDMFINDYVFKGLAIFFDSHPDVRQSILEQL